MRVVFQEIVMKAVVYELRDTAKKKGGWGKKCKKKRVRKYLWTSMGRSGFGEYCSSGENREQRSGRGVEEDGEG